MTTCRHWIASIVTIKSPILLNNWFHKKAGMAVGISAAFSGLMGMMGSSALGFMIPALGWRASYGIIGAASIVLILPVSLFVLRNRPSDKGMLPYASSFPYIPNWRIAANSLHNALSANVSPPPSTVLNTFVA